MPQANASVEAVREQIQYNDSRAGAVRKPTILNYQHVHAAIA
jgi:hypothetical protein